MGTLHGVGKSLVTFHSYYGAVHKCLNVIFPPYRLFYIEGSLTVFVAICALFILPDFPSTTKWLSPLERRLAEVRMAEDVGEKDSDTVGGLEGLMMAITDWKVWWLALNLTAFVISLSFNAYFPSKLVPREILLVKEVLTTYP